MKSLQKTVRDILTAAALSFMAARSIQAQSRQDVRIVPRVPECDARGVVCVQDTTRQVDIGRCCTDIAWASWLVVLDVPDSVEFFGVVERPNYTILTMWQGAPGRGWQEELPG